MNLTGDIFVGEQRARSTKFFTAVNPATGKPLAPEFCEADVSHVMQACAAAQHAFATYRNTDSEARARFLEAIADQILQLGDALLERAHLESGLPLARLTGERGRTMNQLRLFASELRQGSWQGVRIDPALPDRKPLPRSDLRMRKIPLGPVAVFGASNFPLAFSVAGGDTASALAAGCPVVVKGHPAHPGTSEMIGLAINAAVKQCALPSGVFSLLSGTTNELGAALVSDPRIKAVGFTGSRAGGVALCKIAANRADPIPVYAEMSSINPVILMPGALNSRAEKLATDFVTSVTMGSGQFCTNPGLVLAIDSAALDRFVTAVTATLSQTAPTVMLTAGIASAYERGVNQLAAQAQVKRVAQGTASSEPNVCRASLFTTDAAAFISNGVLAHEVFGASSLVVRCRDADELLRVLDQLEGQLTATLHVDKEDEPLATKLLPALESKAGRIIANGWPTGVEVSHAMVHGGPFPATSDSRTTSVGTLAIERFLRPVCYQDLPDSLLPSVLARSGTPGVPHRYDGETRLK